MRKSSAKVIALMFHRVNDPASSFSVSRFVAFFEYLVKHFPIILPGEPLPPVPLAICLTFDDAYYDFYHDVYPLLKKHQVSALLAVPVKYIVEKTSLSPETRLSVPYPQGMESKCYEEKVPFCTWEELNEMARSGYVKVASHGFSHCDITQKSVNEEEELSYSQAVLEKKLNIKVRSFVYPFGKMTYKMHQRVRRFYDDGIRIGGALNRAWQGSDLIYRINADPFWQEGKSFDLRLIQPLTAKYWLNKVRLR